MNHTSKDGGWVCPLCKKKNLRQENYIINTKKKNIKIKSVLMKKILEYVVIVKKVFIRQKEVYYNTNICVARIQIKKFILTIGAEQKSLKNNIQNL